MSTNQITNAISTLYEELERLSQIHEELTDTEVREALHLTLNHFFVWGKEQHSRPVSYRMLSLEGDKAVAGAVNRFLTSIASVPQMGQIPFGIERLALLQNPAMTTSAGYQYDEFIGHVSEPLLPMDLPNDLFEEGDYED